MHYEPKVTIIPLYHAYVWIMPVDLKHLKIIIRDMLLFLSQMGYSIAETELYLVNDAHIARSNLFCLACDGPTNILSFAARDNSSSVLLLSLDTYYRECQLFGQERLPYLVFLLSHGLVHLAGFDHGNDMSKLQNSCIEYLRKNDAHGAWNRTKNN